MPKKVAILHDYLHTYAGSEKVAEEVLKVHPDADIYTSFFVPQNMTESTLFTKAWQEGRVFTSFSQKLLGTRSKFKWFKFLFWLHPFAALTMKKVEDYDLVFVNSVYCSKNIPLGANKKVIHYCHSPANFLYKGVVHETDFTQLNPFLRALIALVTPLLRFFDQQGARKLKKKSDLWLCNSSYSQELIERVYTVKPTICYPPIEYEQFAANPREPNTNRPYFLFYGRLVPYKRLDLALEKCAQAGVRLVVSGDWVSETYKHDTLELVKTLQEKHNLQVRFVGRISRLQNLELMSHCTALLFPGIDAFGIAPIEVLFARVPVIATYEAGAKEWLQPGINGEIFESANLASVKDKKYRFNLKKFTQNDLGKYIKA